MELTYRGHRYQTASVSVEECDTKFACKYRGVPYQLKHRRATVSGAPKTVDLTYRGISYTCTL